MKSLLLLLLATSGLYAQNSNPILNSPITFGKAKIYFQAPYITNPSSLQMKPQFVAYNQNTNLISGNTGNAALLQVENINRGVKIDSFNPNGATNFKEGLVSGALNLIFNGNTGRSFFIN